MIYITYMIYIIIPYIYSIKLIDRYLQLLFIPISPKSYLIKELDIPELNRRGSACVF